MPNLKSKIVFANQQGEAASVDDFTIYQSLVDAKDAMGGAAVYAYYSLDVEAARDSAFHTVPYIGYKGRDAKALRGNTNEFLFTGEIVGQTGASQAEEVNIWNGLLNLLSKNNLKANWKVTLSPPVSANVVISSSGHAVLSKIIAHKLGGRGPRWGFALPFTCLSSAD